MKKFLIIAISALLVVILAVSAWFLGLSNVVKSALVKFDSDAFIDVYSRYTYSADPEKDYFYSANPSDAVYDIKDNRFFISGGNKIWYGSVNFYLPQYNNFEDHKNKPYHSDWKQVSLPNGNELITSGWNKTKMYEGFCYDFYAILSIDGVAIHVGAYLNDMEPEDGQEEIYDFFCSTIHKVLSDTYVQ